MLDQATQERLLANDPTLTHLTLAIDELSAFDVLTLAKVFHENTILKSLTLKKLTINNMVAMSLGLALTTNATLSTLEINECTISGKDAAILISSLKRNHSISELIITDLKNYNDWPETLADILSTNTTLISVDLSNSVMSNNGTIKLMNALAKNATLRSFNLSGTKINIESTRALAQALKHNTTLETLDLGSIPFTQGMAETLADALKMNIGLITLDLSECKINDNSIIALAGAIKINKTLNELNLSDNEFSDRGAKGLAEAIKTNQSIKYLSLANNGEMTENGQLAIIGGMHFNTTITDTDFDVDDEVLDILEHNPITWILKRNNKLSTLIKAMNLALNVTTINEGPTDPEAILDRILNDLSQEATPPRKDLILAILKFTLSKNEPSLYREHLEVVVNLIHSSLKSAVVNFDKLPNHAYFKEFIRLITAKVEAAQTDNPKINSMGLSKLMEPYHHLTLQKIANDELRALRKNKSTPSQLNQPLHQPSIDLLQTAFQGLKIRVKVPMLDFRIMSNEKRLYYINHLLKQQPTARVFKAGSYLSFMDEQNEAVTVQLNNKLVLTHKGSSPVAWYSVSTHPMLSKSIDPNCYLELLTLVKVINPKGAELIPRTIENRIVKVNFNEPLNTPAAKYLTSLLPRLAETLKISHLSAGESKLILENNSTLYLTLSHSLMPRKSSKNPGEYRFALIGKLIGKGSYAEVYDNPCTLRIVNNELILMKNKRRIARIMAIRTKDNPNGSNQRLIMEEDELLKRAHDRLKSKPSFFKTHTTSKHLVGIRFEKCLPGFNLRRLINCGHEYRSGLIHWTLEQRLRVAIALLRAVHEQVHQKDIIHLDIKPDNIMVADFDNESPIVNIIDFNLSRHKTELDAQHRKWGTLIYFSPERFDPKFVPNEVSDVYSTGITVAELFDHRAQTVVSSPEQLAPYAQNYRFQGLFLNLPKAEMARLSDELKQAIEATLKSLVRPQPSDRPSLLQAASELEMVLQRLIAEKDHTPLFRPGGN